MFEQLELPLFAPPSFAQVTARHGVRGLTVTLSGRLRSNWHVIIDRSDGSRQLVVPKALGDAPEAVKAALIEWATQPGTRRPDKRRRLRQRKAELERTVWAYLGEHGGATKARVDPAVYETRTDGQRYDLREVFDSLNRMYFDGKASSYVRWGAPASLTSYQSTARGPDGSRYSLITIAGAYDHPSVPRFAIEGVMFHEMLHTTIPARRVNGRRMVHGREFRKAEGRYPRAREWDRWQGKNLRKLAGQIKRKRTIAARRAATRKAPASG